MEVLAKGKRIKISPKKARPIADLIRGRNTREALIVLSSMPQLAAKEIKKILESAIANAENNFNLEKEELTVKEITIDAGPVTKRYMPRAQGRAFEIKRQTSHIKIIVAGDIKAKAKAGEKKEKKDFNNKGKEKSIDNSRKKESEQPQEKSDLAYSQKSNAPKIFRRKTG